MSQLPSRLATFEARMRGWQTGAILLAAGPALGLGLYGLRLVDALNRSGEPHAEALPRTLVLCGLVVGAGVSLVASHVVEEPWRWRMIGWWFLAAVPVAAAVGPARAMLGLP